MPHLNELREKYEERGLSVLGVTEENQGNTVPWVEKHEMRFAYAYDKTGRTAATFKVRGLPTAVLIDPEGILAWKGNPRDLSDAKIEEVLKKRALSKPLFALEGYTDRVRAALQEERYDDVYAGVGELEAEDAQQELRAALDLVVDRRIRRIEDLFEDVGDYLKVKRRLETIGKSLSGLPMGERIDALDARFKDRHVKKVVRAQEKVLELVPPGARIAHKDKDKIAKQLRKILEDLEGTAAARDAQEALDWIGA